MSQSTFTQHQQALHDAFFADRDQELLDYLRIQNEAYRDEQRTELSLVANIQDPNVLALIQRSGITAASMAAFTLLPLVRLAWADDSVQDNEDAVILKAAAKEGIQYGTPAYRLLSKWLEAKPSEKMINAWSSYAMALARELDESTYVAIADAILLQAKRVAEASGGILGLGKRISENEQLVLQDLANVLTHRKG